MQKRIIFVIETLLLACFFVVVSLCIHSAYFMAHAQKEKVKQTKGKAIQVNPNSMEILKSSGTNDSTLQKSVTGKKTVEQNKQTVNTTMPPDPLDKPVGIEKSKAPGSREYQKK